MRWILIIGGLLVALTSVAQPRTDPFLRKLFRTQKDSLVKHVLDHPETYQYQIIYTQIDRDTKNTPSFKNYYFHFDSLQYFNPASTVKLPIALLALEKLRTLSNLGVNMNTTVLIDSSYSGQTALVTDSTSENGLPSIAHFIKKVFLISDNEAYNRMYEFIGQQTINRRLHSMGYPDVRMTRRFVRMNEDENRHTNGMRFISSDGTLLYQQPPAYNQDAFNFCHVNKMGKAHYANDSLVPLPIDFTTANNLTVFHLQQLLQSVLFPESVTPSKRWALTDEDYNFLYRFLSQYASETDYPKYDSSVCFDSYVKFFFQNGKQGIPPYVRVFNKVGWAYGCMTDASYVVDFKNKVEFMLTATIYVNSDGVMNDDKYEYDTVGLPFFYKLGQLFYQYELRRTRQVVPDLGRFKMEYIKQKDDGRPTIKRADN